MKKRILALTLCLMMFLTSCDLLPKSNDTGETHPSAESLTSAEDTSVTQAPTEESTDQSDPKTPPVEEVKTLTDTDLPDKSTRLALTYDSYDRLGLENVGSGSLGSLYDGNINTRLCYAPTKAVNAYNTAKLASASVIGAVKLFCAAGYQRNAGLELQASADGSSYTTLYTLTEEDVALLEQAPLVVEFKDSGKYLYFRVYHRESDLGYDLNEVELYEGEEPPATAWERVTASYVTVDDGTGNKNLSNVFGDGAGSAANEDTVRKMWNGVHSVYDYCYYKNANAGSWSSASFGKPTVIGKIVLSTNWKQSCNVGTAIQASVDGNSWKTLYTISEADSDFVVGNNLWKLKMLEIKISDTTAYQYIRVYDTAGNGFCFTEVEVFGLVEVVSTETVPLTYLEHGASGTIVNDYNFYGTDRAETEIKYMWDGTVDETHTYFMTWGTANGTAYSMAKTDAPTVIEKIVLAVSNRHDKNVGVQIQASADGENWDVLYTVGVGDGDFVVLNAGTLKYLEFAVSSDTAYSYVRVKDSGTGGFSFAEVQVHTAAASANN